MRLLCLGLLALLLAPASADAQRHHRDRCCERSGRNDFSMEPYAGVYFDALVRDGREVGPLLGLRIGYDAHDRIRLLVDAGYAEINGAGLVSSDQDAATRFTYGNDWIFTLGGAELVLVPGGTAGSITLVGGIGWRRTEVEQRVTGAAPEPDIDGWGAYAVLAPGVTLRHRLGSRAAVRLSFQDYIVDIGEDPDHSPALTLGVSFR